MKKLIVGSSIGQVELDHRGSAIGAGRVNLEQILDIPLLLKDVIDRDSQKACKIFDIYFLLSETDRLVCLSLRHVPRNKNSFSNVRRN